MKRLLIPFIVICLLGVATEVWVYTSRNHPATLDASVSVSTPTPIPTYPIPANVLPIIQRLGIDQSLISRIHIVTPSDNASCQSAGTFTVAACYSPNTMTLTVPIPLLSKDVSAQNSTVAHEYLHYIWQSMSQSEKDSLAPYIEQVYQKDKEYLDKRLVGYDFSGFKAVNRVNELHSYIGTELADSQIPQPLLDHYKKYLPNRNALPSYYPYPTPVYIQPAPRIPMCIPNYIYGSAQDASGHWVVTKTYTGTVCY